MLSLWYSAHIRGWAAQVALLGGLIAVIWWLAGNTVQNMAARGIRTGFEYLWRPARFPISESVVTYTPSDTYLSAYVVGTANTLWISFLAILMATFLGLLVALARRSGNPLLSRIVSILSIFNVISRCWSGSFSGTQSRPRRSLRRVMR